MEGNLPWTLVFVGVGIGIAVEILGIPVLPFAVGLYLPIHLSTPIMVGGLIRLWFEKRKFKSEKARKATIDSGRFVYVRHDRGRGACRYPAGGICGHPCKEAYGWHDD